MQLILTFLASTALRASLFFGVSAVGEQFRDAGGSGEPSTSAVAYTAGGAITLAAEDSDDAAPSTGESSDGGSSSEVEVTGATAAQQLQPPDSPDERLTPPLKTTAEQQQQVGGSLNFDTPAASATAPAVLPASRPVSVNECSNNWLSPEFCADMLCCVCPSAQWSMYLAEYQMDPLEMRLFPVRGNNAFFCGCAASVPDPLRPPVIPEDAAVFPHANPYDLFDLDEFTAELSRTALQAVVEEKISKVRFPYSSGPANSNYVTVSYRDLRSWHLLFPDAEVGNLQRWLTAQIALLENAARVVDAEGGAAERVQYQDGQLVFDLFQKDPPIVGNVRCMCPPGGRRMVTVRHGYVCRTEKKTKNGLPFVEWDLVRWMLEREDGGRSRSLADFPKPAPRGGGAAAGVVLAKKDQIVAKDGAAGGKAVDDKVRILENGNQAGSKTKDNLDGKGRENTVPFPPAIAKVVSDVVEKVEAAARTIVPAATR